MLNSGATGEYVGSVGGYVMKWTKESAIEFAKQFSSPYEVAKANDRAARILRKYGMMDELFPNRQRAHEYTFEEIKELASKYPTRTRFSKGDRNMYYVASKNGWLDILFPKSTSRDSSVSSPEALF